jgi:hypothetical protein
MTRRSFSNLGWTGAIGGLLFLAATGSSFAGTPIPELDPGASLGGIALAIGAALLLAERYRNRA